MVLENSKISEVPVNDEMEEEAELKATTPKKIGILSSGGASTTFVSNIQNLYSELFKNKSYKIYFDTIDFHQPIANIANITAEDKITSKSSEKYLYKTHQRQTQLSSYEHRSVIKPSKEIAPISQVSDDHNLKTQHTSELPDSMEIPLNVLEETEADKHLSLKERAIEIFHKLKKKLGLSSKSVTNESLEQPKNELSSSKENTSQNIDKNVESMFREGDIDALQEVDFEPPSLVEKAENDGMIIYKHDLEKVLKDKDLEFVITYLDDEMDLNNTFKILEVARNLHIFSVVITNLPGYFGKVENVHLMNKVLQRLRLRADMVLLLPYFKSINPKLIPDLILELIELIKEPGLINLDVADLKIIIKGGNVGVISFGTGKGQSRVKDAFFQTIDSKLLNVELAGVNKALLNVTGGSDMTIEEVEAIADQIKNRIKPGARLILGARINQEWNEKIKIFLMLGVSPMQVMINRYANE